MLAVSDSFAYEKVKIGFGELSTLSQMYLPIIGIDSFSLYLFLNNSDDNEKTVRNVLDNLHFNNVGILEYAFNKLEGIGLVKKLIHKSKGYMFVFNVPLDKQSFLNNNLLSNLLYKNIGEVEYKKMTITKEYKGYKDDTKSFDEVFKLDDNLTSYKLENIPKEIKDNIIVKNNKFDYVIFKMLFNDDKIQELLEDSNIKDEILKISYQYSLNEEEMKEAIMQSINKNEDLRIDYIRNRAGYIYQNKKANIVNGESFPEKKPEEYVVELTADENAILGWAINNSIANMLGLFSNGKASLVDVNNFIKVQEGTNLPTEVINIMIFHLSGLKEGENLSYNYIEKVAFNWLKSGIKTAKDAIIHIREKAEKQNKTESKGKTYKKGESLLPEYMKDKSDKDINDNKEITKDPNVNSDVLDFMDEVFGNKPKKK